jgi:hypothetical protein
MFNFLHRTGPRNPSGAIRKALDKDGPPMGIRSASLLRVIESRGRYSDRKVTYIRVFDPVRAAERHLTVRDFSDLDAYPALVLKAGHIEPDGVVVITRRRPEPERETTPLLRAIS